MWVILIAVLSATRRLDNWTSCDAAWGHSVAGSLAKRKLPTETLTLISFGAVKVDEQIIFGFSESRNYFDSEVRCSPSYLSDNSTRF